MGGRARAGEKEEEKKSAHCLALAPSPRPPSFGRRSPILAAIHDATFPAAASDDCDRRRIRSKAPLWVPACLRVRLSVCPLSLPTPLAPRSSHYSSRFQLCSVDGNLCFQARWAVRWFGCRKLLSSGLYPPTTASVTGSVLCRPMTAAAATSSVGK